MMNASMIMGNIIGFHYDAGADRRGFDPNDRCHTASAARMSR